MSERAKQIAEDAARWFGEACKEWAESASEYPIPHIFTLVLGGLLVTVGRWFL